MVFFKYLANILQHSFQGTSLNSCFNEILKTKPQMYCHLSSPVFTVVIVTIQSILQHKCQTGVTRVRHEQKVLILITTRVRHPNISYIANERLEGKKQFHSKNCISEMPRSHAKMRLKSGPHKLNFVMTKAISNNYTLDCSCKCTCTFPYSYAQ